MPPRFVSTASQSIARGSFQSAFETTARLTAAGIVHLGSIRLATGKTAVANTLPWYRQYFNRLVSCMRPIQAVPGRRIPAELSGNATPIIPSGGMALTTKLNGTRHMSWLRLAVPAAGHGAVNKTTTVNHKGQRVDGTRHPAEEVKKLCAAGTTGHVASVK
jgi:hypothetical protein